MDDLELLESYEELIEAKPMNISICWKISMVFLQLLGVISGYGSSILFDILWNEIFVGNCPLWGQVVMPIKARVMSDEIPTDEQIAETLLPLWQQKIIVTFKYTSHCELYHFVSLSSCALGIAWTVLFGMCGKGGYDTRIFEAPWKIVPPAIIFQFIFTIFAMFVVNDLESGYENFVVGLEKITATMNDTHLNKLVGRCEKLQGYLEIFGKNPYDVCQIVPPLRALSWIMAWSWALGLAILIFRVIRVRDFELLTVTAYRVPPEEIAKYLRQESDENAESLRRSSVSRVD